MIEMTIKPDRDLHKNIEDHTIFSCWLLLVDSFVAWGVFKSCSSTYFANPYRLAVNTSVSLSIGVINSRDMTAINFAIVRLMPVSDHP